MKKFRWVSALTSMVMAAALMVTGCSSDGGGSSAPVSNVVSLGNFIANFSDNTIDFDTADLSNVSMGDAVITRDITLKNLGKTDSNARNALTSTITLTVNADVTVNLDNCHGIKIVMKKGTMSYKASDLTSVSMEGPAAIRPDLGDTNTVITAVDVKASGSTISLPAARVGYSGVPVNVAATCEKVTFASGLVSSLELAKDPAANKAKAAVSVTSSSVKFDAVSVTGATNADIEITASEGVSLSDIVPASVLACVKEYVITSVKVVKGAAAVSTRSIFKGTKFDFTGYTLEITKDLKDEDKRNETTSKSETVDMSAANTTVTLIDSETNPLKTEEVDGTTKTFIKFDFVYPEKDSSKLSIKDSSDSFVKVYITGLDRMSPYGNGAYEDGNLVLTFDSAPVLNRNSSAGVKICDNSGNPVDTIVAKNAKFKGLSKPQDGLGLYEMDAIDNLVRVDGNKLIIVPYSKDAGKASSSKLGNGASYSVEIGKGLVSGTIDGVAVNSLDLGLWNFTTRSAPSILGNTITVGKGKNFESIQGALNSIPSDSTAEWTINVDAGTYYERLSYNGKAKINLIGQGTAAKGDDVIVSWKNSNDKNVSGGARSRSTVFIIGECDLFMKGITLVNTWDRNLDRNDSGGVIGNAQAETICFDSTGKLVAYDCSFKSHQDTLYIGAKGTKAWFYKCYIEGDTDYIWGYGDVCLIEDCDLRCIADPVLSKQKSYIFASRSIITQKANKGFVLINSRVKVDAGVTAYFARNSGADTQATVVNNTFTVNGVLNPTLYGSAAEKIYDVAGEMAIGYKDGNNKLSNGAVISTSSRLVNCGSVSSDLEEREYSGRWVILNRGYNKEEKEYQYVGDEEEWDVTTAYASKIGDENITADASKDNIYLDPVFIDNMCSKVELLKTAVIKVRDAKDNDITASAKVTSENNDAVEIADGNASITVKDVTEKVYVKITAEKDGKFAYAKICVLPEKINVTGVSVTGPSATVSNGAVTSLSVSLTPSVAGKEPAIKTVVWETSTPDVVKFVDETKNALVTKITGTASSVKMVALSAGQASVTAKSVPEASESGSDVYTSTPATFSVSEYVTEWSTAVGGILVNSDPQNGTSAAYNRMIIDCVSKNNEGGKTAKMAMKAGNTSSQTRNVILWIPIDRDARVKVTLGDGSTYADTNIAYAAAATTPTVALNISYGDGSGATLAKKYAKVEFGSSDVKVVKIERIYAEGSVPLEKEVENKNYVFKDMYAASGANWENVPDGTHSSDNVVSLNGYFSTRSDGLLQAKGGAVMTFKLTKPGVVTFTVDSNTNDSKLYTVKNGETVLGEGILKSENAFIYSGTTEADITCTFTGGQYLTAVNVKDLEEEVASVSAVTISGDSSVTVGETLALKANVTRTYLAPYTIDWSSSSESIAAVSSSGVVSGVAAGNATITATVHGTTISNTKAVTVEVPSDGPVTATWNFKGSSADETAIQSRSNSPVSILRSDKSGIALVVDASAGKFQIRASDWAIFNNGTKFYIPVIKDAVVTYTGYDNNYTVDGVAAENAVTTKTAAADGVVVIESTAASGYMGSISVAYPSKPVIAMWDFEHDYPSTVTTVNIEGSTGTVASTLDGKDMTVDATSGKFKYATTRIQFNAGTVAKVPVKEGSVVVTGSYKGQSYTLGGENVTCAGKYVATSADAETGFVEITSTAQIYLYNVFVIDPKPTE